MYSIEGKRFALKKEEIQALFGMITEENREGRIVSSKEIINKTKEWTTIYKTYDTINKMLEQFEENSIEKCLGPAIQQIKYLARALCLLPSKQGSS